jgi:hypothetical protein
LPSAKEQLEMLKGGTRFDEPWGKKKESKFQAMEVVGQASNASNHI